jgi:hypothetical protein
LRGPQFSTSHIQLEFIMKFTKVMLAVAVMSVGASAFAAPNVARIAISSGASASKGNQALALASLCTAAGGTMTEFASGGNISTYVCNTTAAITGTQYASAADSTFKNFAGTSFAELRLNVSGGSFTAVCSLNNWPSSTVCGTVNAGGAADKYVDPATGGTVFAQPGQALIGGLMDTSPDTWPSNVTAGLQLPAVDNTGVAQSFGVGVSDLLYTAMFNYQKSAGGATIAKPIPSTCAVTDTGRAECVPTVSKGQMATIMANNEFNAAYSNGVGFLAGPAFNGVELEYGRRADTSGTQASAQAYFLGLPCNSAPLTIVDTPAVGGSNTIGAIKVFAHSGTGNLRTALNAAVYGIGIMSGENNQSSSSWKWIRVQGAPMAENAKPGTAGITNRDSVKNGSYDFFVESKVAVGAATGAANFWSAVTGSMSTLAAPVGLMNASDLASYNKGNNTCQFNISN